MWLGVRYLRRGTQKRWPIAFGCLCVLPLSSALAQKTALGQFRTHFSYNQAFQFSLHEEALYCHAKHSLLWFHPVHKTWEKTTQINGLSGSHITTIGADAEGNTLALGHKNGVIDIRREGRWTSIAYLAQLRLALSKGIRHITFAEKTLYVAGDFGIILVDRASLEPKSNYFGLGRKGEEASILQVMSSQNFLFATTKEEALVGSKSDPLQDYRQWKRFSLSSSTRLQWIDFSGSVQLWVSKEEETEVYRYQEGQLQRVDRLPYAVQFARTHGESLYFGTGDRYVVQQARGDRREVRLRQGASAFQDVVLYEDKIWLADTLKGLAQVAGQEVRYLPIQQPVRAPAHRLFYVDDALFALPRRTEVPATQLSVFKDERWVSHAVSNEPPYTLHEWLRTEQGYLRATQDMEKPFSPPMSWLGGMRGSVKRMFEASNQDVWVILTRPDGEDELLVFNLISRQHLSLQRIEDFLSGAIHDIAFDRRGQAWIANDGGLVVVQNAPFLLQERVPSAFRPALRESFVFQRDPVLAIFIDGADNRWVASERGLHHWHVRAETLTLLSYPNGSALPTPIYDLAANPNTGEIFISTAQGILSYRSLASAPEQKHTQVRIFPNPVPKGYVGYVAVSGLPYRSTVKFTTPSGNLVREVESDGGTATLLAEELAMGIYVVFSSDSRGNDTYVGKIAVLR